MSTGRFTQTEVTFFAWDMQDQLDKNAGRGGWKDCKPGYLHERIQSNLVDLGTYRAEKNWVAYRRTCADIGNFAMMLADNSKRTEQAHGAPQ